MAEHKELYFDEDDDDGDDGICLDCGCTGGDPCVNEDGNTCSWTDDEHDLCSFCEKEATI